MTSRSAYSIICRQRYRVFILGITFVSYTAYHLSRRPLSVVKNVLSQNCSTLKPPPDVHITSQNKDTWCSWAPFDGKDANELLGYLDSAFLFMYAFFMFVSGFVAERVDLRYFLAIGMLMSGVFTYLFGLAYSQGIHSFTYLIIVQLFCGAFQSTGWPSLVTCLGNWFGKARRGLLFGLWNSHLYLGNILGAYVAGVYVEENWGYSFIIPAGIVGVSGFLIFLFLVPAPEDVGCKTPVYHHGSFGESTETAPLIDEKINPNLEFPNSNKAITFWGALKIPGVIDFSLCLFFAKLVSYTFLFWLPKYIASSTPLSSEQSAYLSVPFDIGGIIGGVLAGYIADHTGASAVTCASLLGIAVPTLFLYDAFGQTDMISNIVLQVIGGAAVNGPYALITTAVSAELGTHKSLMGNSKALATVTAIIDGTGSVGAAIGPLLAGFVSETSWNNVFYMVMVSDFLAVLALLRVVWHEARRLRRKGSWCCVICACCSKIWV
ncbi:glucose-6-phosphate exchanger SLC37A2-like isoform X2 [Tachypleus tridentatus]|uniref:glucose-6-phosphate exchanger SLC37A2-like isoform X2 n=1 Tax=Tachypleus tridentatus TaxID=6853 RepID=UPI003FCFDED1